MLSVSRAILDLSITGYLSLHDYSQLFQVCVVSHLQKFFCRGMCAKVVSWIHSQKFDFNRDMSSLFLTFFLKMQNLKIIFLLATILLCSITLKYLQRFLQIEWRSNNKTWMCHILPVVEHQGIPVGLQRSSYYSVKQRLLQQHLITYVTDKHISNHVQTRFMCMNKNTNVQKHIKTNIIWTWRVKNLHSRSGSFPSR